MSSETHGQPDQAERDDQGRSAVTRRQMLGYGSAAAAGVAATSLLGAGPAAADEGGGPRGSVEMRSVSLPQANRIVAAGIAYVRDHEKLPPMFIMVVDVCGDEKASRRMDGNGAASVTLVPLKARTSAAFRAATADLAANVTDPARIASFTTAGFSLLGGGRPIVENEKVIGAVGVGGGTPEQDDEVARAALEGL